MRGLRYEPRHLKNLGCISDCFRKIPSLNWMLIDRRKSLIASETKHVFNKGIGLFSFLHLHTYLFGNSNLLMTRESIDQRSQWIETPSRFSSIFKHLALTKYRRSQHSSPLIYRFLRDVAQVATDASVNLIFALSISLRLKTLLWQVTSSQKCENRTENIFERKRFSLSSCVASPSLLFSGRRSPTDGGGNAFANFVWRFLARCSPICWLLFCLIW